MKKWIHSTKAIKFGPHRNEDDDVVPIKADEIEGDKKMLSQVSFDFAHDGYYTRDDIDRIINTAFEAAGVEFVASDYYAVDYSMYDNLKDLIISQASADFEWVGDYDQHIIEKVIDKELAAIGYELIGIDFRSLDPVESVTDIEDDNDDDEAVRAMRCK